VRYRRTRAFEKSIKRFDPQRRIDVQSRVDAFVRAIESRQVPEGFGLKKLKETIWEFRIGLALRVLFQWHKDVVTFLFIGNHTEVQQFLRHFFI